MPVLLLERCKEMNETEIRKYAELMKELGLVGLEITDEKTKVRLECPAAASAKEVIYSVPEKKADIPQSSDSKDYVGVKSPIVGVFYASPAENVAPYVSIGSTVKKGQILCIVEAMKLMNEITAEEDGVISEVCVANGQIVEYGTELFRIKR